MCISALSTVYGSGIVGIHPDVVRLSAVDTLSAATIQPGVSFSFALLQVVLAARLAVMSCSAGVCV
jgi:hypothetical protein